MTKKIKRTWVVETDDQRLKHMTHLSQKPLPYTATDKEGAEKDKSTPQNSLNHKWLTEVAQQNQQHSREEYRGICKLHCGVPVLRRDSEEYREAYDRLIKPMDYWSKVEYMMAPLDFPVTRGMTDDQMREYLHATHRLLTEKFNAVLTQPKDRWFYE